MRKSSPPPRRVGYARVSTGRQDLGAQIAELEAAGCTEVFAETISTRTDDRDRPELQSCLAALQPGDVLTVSKLDRLGRTQAEVIARLHQLQQQGIHVHTLDGLINTAALGKMAPLVIGLLTGLAEVERELIRERTVASIEHRRATGGDLGGRPRSYTPEQQQLGKRLQAEGKSLSQIGKALGISKSAAGRMLTA